MRYDFGGGCRAFAYDDDITIVDIQTIYGNDCIIDCPFGPETKCKSDRYIMSDIFSKDLILPEFSSFINVSMVLRYFAGPHEGYIKNEEIDSERLKQVGYNIVKYMRHGGIVRLFDNMDVMEDVIQVLFQNNFKIISCDLVNPRDRDYAAEWEVILR